METLSQDEVLVNDMLKLAKQVNYLHWARRHDIEVDEATLGPETLDYRKAFGLS